jgi:hypothetical protein
MSQFTDGKRRTFKAGAGLTAAQYLVVKQDTDGTVILAGANGTGAIGILNNQPATSDSASVVLRSGQGTAKILLGGSVTTYGSAITSQSGGTGIVTTTAGDQVIGTALQLGSSGDIIEIMLTTGKYGA